MGENAPLEPGRELGSLLDGALGVEFGGKCGPTDNVRVYAITPQFILQIAERFLAGTDHHVVDRKQLWARPVRAEADVQAVIGDPLVAGIPDTQILLGVPSG